MTEAENRLWRALREGFAELGFRRQHPIGRYIVDFACPAKLVIELDCGPHAAAIEADALRSQEIARRGYRVIQFWNGDLMGNFAGVLETIRQEIDISLSPLGAERVGVRWEEPQLQNTSARPTSPSSPLTRRVPSLSP